MLATLVLKITLCRAVNIQILTPDTKLLHLTFTDLVQDPFVLTVRFAIQC